MNVDIRKYIRDNFKKASITDLEASIESSIKSKEEVTLPGLGVFFEVLWENCSEDNKNTILTTLVNYI